LKGIGCTPFSVPLRAPGETLGPAASSSLHPFLKVLAWYAVLQSAKSMVGILRRAHWLWIVLVFVDPTLWTLLSFLVSFLFLSFSFFFF
jgi:hypothetical protein